MRRIVILTEGSSDPAKAKTATGVLRYRGDEVVAVLDSTCVGKTAQELLGVGGDTPFVAELSDLPDDVDTLLIGIAPAGGGVPAKWRAHFEEPIDREMEIVSGLHLFLGDDPELSARADAKGVRVYDVRKPPEGIPIATNAAKSTSCYRVHTVGHDCSVGKMVTSLELTRALGERGHSAKFLATGQTGIMIEGDGIPIDAVTSDFVAGAAESMVLEHQHNDFLVVEGQGSLIHPLFSGVTLGLLHGCAPQAMVFCYDPLREEIKYGNAAMPPLREVASLFEQMASLITPSIIVGIAANTSALSESNAKAELERVGDEFGLPATDVVRYGPNVLVDAILEARERDGSSS